ncbi:MAG TPA: tyrosine-type recombinase/integrase [Actinomycetota bacterium]
MTAKGTVTAKCRRGHRRAEGRCGSRCLRWYWVLDVGPGPDGRRRRRWSQGFDRKAEAEAALRAELDRRDQNIGVDASKVTVAGFAERWLAHVKATRDEGTWAEYTRNLKGHVLPALGGRQLKTLGPADLDGLYAQLLAGGRLDGRPGGLSARTVRNVHKTVHKMLRQAVRWRLLPANPAADLELPPVIEPKMVTLDHDQARRLLEVAAGPRRAGWWAPLVLLAVATGARRGELLALRWSDLDLDAGTFTIGRSLRRGEAGLRYKAPKTRAGQRTVGLGPSTVAALRRLRADQAERRLAFGAAYHADEDLVVCQVDGAPLRPDHVSSEFRRLAEAAGLPPEVHLHTLRHSAASFLAAAGVPASDIAAPLGHADGGSLALRVYVHPLEEGKRRAAAQLDQVIGGEHGR